MANEFVARRGIIAQSGGAKITGSLLVSGTIDATGFNIIASSLTGSFSGSIGTATTASHVIPSGLPAGTVSASSQIDYNSIQNKLSGVISSSTQFNALSGTSASFATTASFALNATIPAGTISSSTQFNTLTNPLTGSFTGSFIGDGSGLTGIATSLGITGSTGTATVNLKTQGLTINGGNGITTNATGQSVTVSAPAGTVSSSAQVDITATTNYSTFSSSIATKNNLQDVSINALNTATSSYAVNSTIQGQLAGVVSSSTQVKPLLPGGTVSSSTQTVANLPTGTVSSSGQIVVQNTTGIGALATTGSNIFNANQTITGSLFISQNLTVFGSSSISYISQSVLNIGTNKITVNVDSPAVRFGGLDVIDSGSSPQRSGSILFDSINDQFIFVHANTAGGVTSSVLLVGPATFNNIGNETTITQNRVLKGAGLEHITDSQISDNGITVSITNGLSAGTTITASAFTATTTSSLAAVYSSSAQAVAAVAGQTIAPNTVNATNITVSSVLSGSASTFLNNTLYSGSTVTGIVGPVSNQVVAALSATDTSAVFFDYVINDGTNYRAGIVMVVDNGTSVEFTDTSTADIGNTAQAIFNVDIAGGLIRLKFTNTSSTWTVKTAIRAL